MKSSPVMGSSALPVYGTICRTLRQFPRHVFRNQQALNPKIFPSDCRICAFSAGVQGAASAHPFTIGGPVVRVACHADGGTGD